MPEGNALGPLLASIMGSQDREFEHQSSMQSRSLSAQQGMHSASLANALKIAKMNNSTQRYGIDVGAETARRGQDFDQEARRWQNALTYLQTAAQLRGPDDWLSYLNFSRGAANNGAPAFLQALMNGGGVQDFGAWGGTPAPPSMAKLAADLGYTGGGQAAPNGTGGMTDQQQQTVNMVDTIAQNMHRLAPGTLEGLNEDETKFLFGTAASRGHSIPTLLAQYQNAGINQGNSRAA